MKETFLRHMLKSCINSKKRKPTGIPVSFIQLCRPGYPLSGCSSALPDSVSPWYSKLQIIRLSIYKFFWALNRYRDLQHFENIKEVCSIQRLPAPFIII